MPSGIITTLTLNNNFHVVQWFNHDYIHSQQREKPIHAVKLYFDQCSSTKFIKKNLQVCINNKKTPEIAP